MSTATFSLKNMNHDFNVERFKTRLTAKCCVVFVVVMQIIIRLIIFLILKDQISRTAQIAFIVSLPLLALTALVVCFEYFLFKRIGPRVMNYSTIIDLILLVLFTVEWIDTLFISLAQLSVTNPPSVPISSIFTFAGFGWRTLFLLFLIQGWKWLIIAPTLALALTMGYVLHYVPNSSWWYLLLVSISTVIYTILILYFMDKIKWKEVFTNTQQERWMQINQFVLNNIPENILILDIGGQVNFVSEYCKAFMKSSHLDGRTRELFTKIRGVTQQPETHPSPDKSSHGERATTTYCMLERASGQTLPNSPIIDSLEDLIEHFKVLINDSQLQEKEFLIYNGKLSVEDHQTKSIEIKISHVQQYARKYIILIIRDTTQRDLLVTLQDNNKYKDQLLASVSHELRTPLNGNINLVESALQDKNVPISVKEGLLTPALRSSQFLLHLINDILDMSQIKAKKLRLIFSAGKLKETLKNTLQLVELQAKKKGVELVMNIHPNIDKINLSTDHVRLSQIVLNLLNNAIKFTQKGSVKLSAQPTEDSSCIKISVQDSGIGMTDENIKKLFSDYTHIEFAERKEINPTGVGLGLRIAYDLAKLLGPTTDQQGITVESELNFGSTFSFILEDKGEKVDPKDRQRSRSASSSFSEKGELIIEELQGLEHKVIYQSSSMSPMMTNRNLKKSLPSECSCPKILIVDDNPFNTMAFEAVLRSLNFKCDSVFDGRNAIEKILDRQKTRCGANCKPYNVVFMDQEMPGLTGSEATQEIKKLQVQGLMPEMKIIGCTAHGSPEEIENFMKSGIDFCIQKPIQAHEIRKILKDENHSS